MFIFLLDTSQAEVLPARSRLSSDSKLWIGFGRIALKEEVATETTNTRGQLAFPRVGGQFNLRRRASVTKRYWQYQLEANFSPLLKLSTVTFPAAYNISLSVFNANRWTWRNKKKGRNVKVSPYLRLEQESFSQVTTDPNPDEDQIVYAARNNQSLWFEGGIAFNTYPGVNQREFILGLARSLVATSTSEVENKLNIYGYRGRLKYSHGLRRKWFLQSEAKIWMFSGNAKITGTSISLDLGYSL